MLGRVLKDALRALLGSLRGPPQMSESKNPLEAYFFANPGRLPQVDIVIDDGGHAMRQQIVSFEELYPHLQPHGVYLCEDIHTSVAPQYGGGYRRAGTFLEYAKGLVDQLYAWYSYEPERFAVNAFTRGTYALHFYDSVLVVEKRPMQAPQQSQTGRPSF
jgi:hypothetical protein